MPDAQAVPIADLKEARREEIRKAKIAKFGGSRFVRVIRADKYDDYRKMPADDRYRFDDKGRRIL